MSRPQTLEELRQFAEEYRIPAEEMRFALGTRKTSPKWFGIYQDGTEWVVYKNKADGSTAVRYRGSDEAQAVAILVEKMYEEAGKRGLDLTNMGRTAFYSSTGKNADIAQVPPIQRGRNEPQRSSGHGSGYPAPRKPGGCAKIIGIIVLLVLAVAAIRLVFFPSRVRYSDWPDGYYYYEDSVYYNDDGYWYGTDGYGFWYEVEPESGWRDYYYGYDYDFPEEDYYYGYWSGYYDGYDNGYYSSDNDYDYNDSGWDSYDSDYDSWDSYDSGWDYDSSDWDSDW